jgi:hypothetical protein
MEIRTVVTWIFGILSAAGLVAVAENYKEWLKLSGVNTLLVRVVDKILPTQLQKRLSWQYLHTAGGAGRYLDWAAASCSPFG